MTFEDLDAWKEARKLVAAIYVATREQEMSRDFGFCSQIQRASVSVMSNIAEGFERVHLPEKMQAYNIARASCGEVRSLLYVMEDNWPATDCSPPCIRELSNCAGSLISGLIASTRRRAIVKKTGGALVILAIPIFYLLTSLS